MKRTAAVLLAGQFSPCTWSMMDSITTPQIHSVLIARHCKLVVEEYFHGYDRYKPQIISSEWARKSGSTLRNLTRTQQYGWRWNSVEFPYNGRTVRGVFAGGNYGQAASFVSQREYTPQYILPAIGESRARVTPR